MSQHAAFHFSDKLRNLKMLGKQMQIGRTSRNVMTHHDAVDIGFWPRKSSKLIGIGWDWTCLAFFCKGTSFSSAKKISENYYTCSNVQPKRFKPTMQPGYQDCGQRSLPSSSFSNHDKWQSGCKGRPGSHVMQSCYTDVADLNYIKNSESEINQRLVQNILAQKINTKQLLYMTKNTKKYIIFARNTNKILQD